MPNKGQHYTQIPNTSLLFSFYNDIFEQKLERLYDLVYEKKYMAWTWGPQFYFHSTGNCECLELRKRRKPGDSGSRVAEHRKSDKLVAIKDHTKMGMEKEKRGEEKEDEKLKGTEEVETEEGRYIDVESCAETKAQMWCNRRKCPIQGILNSSLLMDCSMGDGHFLTTTVGLAKMFGLRKCDDRTMFAIFICKAKDSISCGDHISAVFDDKNVLPYYLAIVRV